MVLFTRASKVVRMGLYGLMVRFSTFLDAPRRTLVPCLPERIAAVKFGSSPEAIWTLEPRLGQNARRGERELVS